MFLLIAKSMLDNRDYSFILARSPESWAYKDPSFIHWKQAETAIIKIAKQCQEYDPDGICVYSAIEPFEKYNKTKVAKLAQILRRQNPPEIKIDPSAPLEDALNNYFLRRESYIYRNGEIILVFLDKKPEQYERLFEVIIEATKKVTPTRQRGKIYELGISFIQIGEDKETADFLDFLDDDLQTIGAKHDIVDAKNWLTINKLAIDKFLKDALFD